MGLKTPLNKSLIRPKCDYGFIIYGSAHKSYLKDLDAIHHQGLHICCLGAYKTYSLYVEANEPPLHLMRNNLSL